MLKTLRRAKTTTNPVFYPERVRSFLERDPERLERIFANPDSVDLVTWNVFTSMDSDPDRDYLAALLQPLAGNDLRAPVRVRLWTGRHREPFLRASAAYVRHIRDKVRDEDADLSAFLGPIEVPLLIVSPDLLALVDTTLGTMPRGAVGRDRLPELVDAGLEHARNLGKSLVVAVVYRSGTEDAARLSSRINSLRDPDRLAAALPWHDRLPDVRLRELSWQQLIRIWENERAHLKLSGQPVRAFLEHAGRLGLR